MKSASQIGADQHTTCEQILGKHSRLVVSIEFAAVLLSRIRYRRWRASDNLLKGGW